MTPSTRQGESLGRSSLPVPDLGLLAAGLGTWLPPCEPPVCAAGSGDRADSPVSRWAVRPPWGRADRPPHWAAVPPGARWRVWKGSRMAWSLPCSAAQPGPGVEGRGPVTRRAVPKNWPVRVGKVAKEFPGAERTKGPQERVPCLALVSARTSCAIPRPRGRGLPPAITLSLPAVTIHRVSVFPGNPLPLGEPVLPPSPMAGVSGGPWPRLSLWSPPVGVGISTRTLRSESTEGSSKHGRHHGARRLPSPGAERGMERGEGL